MRASASTRKTNINMAHSGLLTQQHPFWFDERSSQIDQSIIIIVKPFVTLGDCLRLRAYLKKSMNLYG
jgi:hypothetical protein